MSGISGVWNLDGRPLATATLRSVSAQLAPRGKDGEYLWIEGPIGLACQLLRTTPESDREVQPFLHSSGTALVFDGRLDDRDELLAALKNEPVDPSMPDPELVAAAYARWGEDFLLHLNGDFALALFDTRRQKLILGRDPIGPRPLYYCSTGQTVIFATEIKAILAHPQVPREPNEDAIAGHVIGAAGPERGVTLFKDCWRVVPSHITVFTRDQISTRQYWDFDPEARLRLKSIDEYTEAFRIHFERAVQRRIRTRYPVGVFVSGGLDSSAVFCQAERLRLDGKTPAPAINGVSYVTPEGTRSDERQFIEIIERQYGVSIDRSSMDMSEMLAEVVEHIRRTEIPELNLGAALNENMATVLQKKGSRTLLTGHWGDQVLCSTGYLVDLLYQLRWFKIHRHLNEIPRWFTDCSPASFRTGMFRHAFQDFVVSRSPGFLSRYVVRKRAAAVLKKRDRSWYTDSFRASALRHGSSHDLHWRRFHSASARLLYKGIRDVAWVLAQEYMNKWVPPVGMDVAYPFIDKDLLSFGMQIPGEMHVWNGVPKALLRRGMAGVMPSEICQRTWKGDATDLENDALSYHYSNFLTLMGHGTIASKLGYIYPKRVAEELQSYKQQMGGSCVAAWSVEGLIGLEYWLKTFFPDRAA